ncbi:LIC_13387 family protein [Litoribrevibacter albus]|uniref:Uncharacterized protein n=1 Tax=Litoribrevibacter albus TaxID=1473156 RepID=A0AA37S6F0_9GAMM|nr:hypothetical protein [Litoribrevibacter albus]GLQ30021.1 hypothetical protein GCM10007876_04990 [Litoribrevibacter albus]
MEQALIIISTAIFGMLGVAHLILTFYSRKFEARDTEVTTAMKHTSPVITKETSVWDAWIGFNASHSLGALMIPLFYIPLALTHPNLLLPGSYYFVVLLVLAGSYLFLAKRYWFKVPFRGIALANLCLWGAFIMSFLN